jgi:hypothetical protein
VNTPPPIFPEYQRQRDDDHLRLLAVFHFVMGGLALLGPVFLFLHYTVMNRFLPFLQTVKVRDGATLPGDFLDSFVWFYVFMGVVCVVAGVLNVLSGVFLRRRRHRVFSLVVAGLNCLQIPFGTVLGVFTFVVLLRDSVRESYFSRPA